jgi:Tfp pilus assembly protein PilX
MFPRVRSELPSLGARQRGVVLFVALIVLVAMTLTGIAIMRSVDTGNLVAGNAAFKQSTKHTADLGIDDAYGWIRANRTTGKLNGDDPAEAYYAVASDPKDWSDDAVWADAKVVADDGSGNRVSYIIHRLCDAAGDWQGASCARVQKKGADAGNSMGFFGAQFKGTTVVYFRVTVRVDGARDTMSIVQSNLAIQM